MPIYLSAAKYTDMLGFSTIHGSKIKNLKNTSQTISMDSFGKSQSWHRVVNEAGKELFKGDISGVNPRETKEDEEASGNEPGSLSEQGASKTFEEIVNFS